MPGSRASGGGCVTGVIHARVVYLFSPLNKNSMTLSVGIVGFSGYSGAEAVRILARHPYFEPVLLAHRADASEGARLVRKPAIRQATANADSVASEGLKAVLLATAPDVSMNLAPKFLEAGAIVVDLSGAFRLRTPECYKRWYGEEDHTAAAFVRAGGVQHSRISSRGRCGARGCCRIRGVIRRRPIWRFGRSSKRVLLTEPGGDHLRRERAASAAAPGESLRSRRVSAKRAAIFRRIRF